MSQKQLAMRIFYLLSSVFVLLININYSIAQNTSTDCNCDITIDNPSTSVSAENNTTICLEGNFTYTQGILLGSNSTLCVGENVTLTGNLDVTNYGDDSTTINNYGTIYSSFGSFFRNFNIYNYGTIETNLNFNASLNPYLYNNGSFISSNNFQTISSGTIDNSGILEFNGLTLNQNFNLNTTENSQIIANGNFNINGSHDFQGEIDVQNNLNINNGGNFFDNVNIEANAFNASGSSSFNGGNIFIDNNFNLNNQDNQFESINVETNKLTVNGNQYFNGTITVFGLTKVNSGILDINNAELILDNIILHSKIRDQSGCSIITINGNSNGWGNLEGGGDGGINLTYELPNNNNWTLIGNVGVGECDFNAEPEPTVWIGVVSTDAENINNWSNGFPNRYIDVIINVTPNDPNFSEDAEMKDLEIVNGAGVSQSNESQINIYGDFENHGYYNPGNSTLAFKSDEIQNFSTENKITVYNLTIDNGTSLNLVSGNVDIYNTLNLKSGDLITNYDYNNENNNLVTFKSNSNTTAIISEIENGNTIVGDVMIERFIPLQNRAFRYITTSVNTSTSINENWQEGVNNTVNDYDLNQNPKPGYGTHITGSTTGENGFDATLTGNPSLFSWNPQNGSWVTITSTLDNNLEAGKAYGLLIRGDRSTNVWSSNSAMGSPTRLRSLGTILSGDVNIDDDLNPNPDGFSLIGNPYQAEVDMKATLANSSNHLNKNFYYAYNPNLGNRGGYVTVDLDANPVQYVPKNTAINNNNGNGKYKFLQPNQAAFVQTSKSIQAGETPTLTFKEEFKTDQTLTNQVFSVNSNSKIDLNIINNSSNELMDGVRFRFGATFNEEVDTNDAKKFWNNDETIGIESNGNYLAIEKRPFPEDEDIFGFWIGNYRDSDYTMNVEVQEMPNYNIFLRDTYTNVDHELNDGENDIAFTIDSSIPASVNSDRFKLVFEQTTLSDDDFELNENNFSLFPNPSTNGYFTIKGEKLGTSETKVEIFNAIGQQVKTIESDFKEEITINTNEFNAGIYIVKINSEGQQITKKVIIK